MALWGVFVVLYDYLFHDHYGFAARTRLLGKPVQTAVTLSAPVSPNLCLAIRGGRLHDFLPRC